MSKSVKIVQVSRTQQLNWWGFSLELSMVITEEDLRKLLDTIELPKGKKLNIIIEGRPPRCFVCRQRGHVMKKSPLIIQHKVDKIIFFKCVMDDHQVIQAEDIELEKEESEKYEE